MLRGLPTKAISNLLPTNGFSIKPLKVKLLAGEQKATEIQSCIPVATYRFPFEVLLHFLASLRRTLPGPKAKF